MALRSRLVSLAAVLATLLGGLGLSFLWQKDAQAHGVAMMPGSRTYLCQLDAVTGTGALDPTNPACKAALNQSGATALYNWFAVLDSQAAWTRSGLRPGRHAVQRGRPLPLRLLRLQRGPLRLAAHPPDIGLDDQGAVQQLGRAPG